MQIATKRASAEEGMAQDGQVAEPEGQRRGHLGVRILR